MKDKQIKKIINKGGFDTNVDEEWFYWIECFKIGLQKKKSQLVSEKDFSKFKTMLVKDIKNCDNWEELGGTCDMVNKILIMTERKNNDSKKSI